MKVYLLQIHRDGELDDGSVYDELFHFDNLGDLEAEFRNKMNYYTAHDLDLLVWKIPELDEDTNEVYGCFEFRNKAGDRVMARASDLDIGD